MNFIYVVALKKAQADLAAEQKKLVPSQIENNLRVSAFGASVPSGLIPRAMDYTGQQVMGILPESVLRSLRGSSVSQAENVTKELKKLPHSRPKNDKELLENVKAFFNKK